jgi:hypothetical protein
MSISGLGSALGSMIDPMGATTAKKPTTTGYGAAADNAKAAADAAKAKVKSDLDAIREKGIYAWAQEQKLEAMKAKIKQQVMDEKKLTEDQISKLPPDQQVAVKSTIEEEVARRIKEAMETQLKSQLQAKTDQGKAPGPMIIDISV